MSDRDDMRVLIRSHRDDFDFEKRIYALQLEPGGRRAVRLNPSGIPHRGLGYAAVALATMFVARRTPLIELAAGAIPALVAYLLLPAGIAALLTLLRPGGRVFHKAVRALIGHLRTPRHLQGLRRCPPKNWGWRPTPIVTLASGAEARCRRLAFKGPGAIWIGRPHSQRVHSRLARRMLGRPDVTLTELDAEAPSGRGRPLRLKPGRRIEIHPS